MEESIRGAPRYLEGREAEENLRMHLIFLWVMEVVLKKNICDLANFVEMPEALEKRSRMALIASDS